MSLLEDVQTFVHEVNRASEFREIETLLNDTVKEFGFDYFALVHHVKLTQTKGDAVYLFNYPEAWADMLESKDYFSDDPVLMACQKSAAPFTWAEVPKMMPLTNRQIHILESAKLAGIGSGFTVPIHIPGEYAGSCTFSTRYGKDVPSMILPAAHYVGCFAFEAARRVVQRTSAMNKSAGPVPQHPKLTRRQLDCVLQAGRGKSDRDVAQILGISNHSVHQHMEDAKRKYDVATRMQLIVRVLLDNQIAFADLIS
jgi:LuxR family transcriptional regulator, quorum-sensing system regulator CciR